MKIRNISPKGKWIFIKMGGYSYKKFVHGYGLLDIPEVTRLDQLNLNSHEEAMIKAGEQYDEPKYRFTINSSVGATGGTTSLSASTITVAKGMSLSFDVYTESNYYVSAYTLNNQAKSILTPSASTTTYTISNITQDQNIYFAFSTYGS